MKVRLGLEKIAELEGLKPTEEETEAEYQKLADAYGMPLESVKNLVTVEGINGDIQNQKAIDLVKANAVVVEKKAEEEQAEGEKAREEARFHQEEGRGCRRGRGRGEAQAPLCQEGRERRGKNRGLKPGRPE